MWRRLRARLLGSRILVRCRFVADIAISLAPSQLHVSFHELDVAVSQDVGRAWGEEVAAETEYSTAEKRRD